MLKMINLDYDFLKILSADYSQHEGSCISHQVYELTDIHDQYGGFPTTYCYENTKIHQLWWEKDDVDFVEIGRQLGIEVITVSSICQPPGCMIPLHRDTFYQINKRYPNRTELKVRANIYLEDWKLGQFLQYDDEINVKWRAGDGIMWDSSHLHLSANAGMQNKYTLQVSGFLLQ
jgi:hypothetical protein